MMPDGSTSLARGRMTAGQRTGRLGWCVSAYDVLRRVLSDHPIAVHPELARDFGGISEALFFHRERALARAVGRSFPPAPKPLRPALFHITIRNLRHCPLR